MYGTRNDFLPTSGSSLNSNSRVSVVIFVVLLGVPRVWFFYCMVDLLHTALRPMRERDDVVSKKAVFLFTFGGLVQPEGSSSRQIFVV